MELYTNLSLQNSTPTSMKYFITILFKATNGFCGLDYNLHGLNYFI